MGRVSLFIYLAIASLIILLINHTPTKRPTAHRHRRLRLRSNFTFNPPLHRQQHDHHIPFDPLIADIVLRREDKEWEKHQQMEHSQSSPDFSDGESAPPAEPQPEWEEFINDEERFNVSERLLVLFPKIDVDPPDGFVSVDELTRWNLQQAMRETLHRSEREMQSHDKDHDGFVSFAEYEPPSWVLAAGNSSFGYDIAWWKEEHFNASDADGDGLLNTTEFNDFLHPADSKNPKLLLWLCADEVRERDTNQDGKLDFSEFFHGIFDLLRRDDDEDHSSSHQDDDPTKAPAKKLFSKLDTDNDGYLSATEVLPLIGKIHPSEGFYARQQAEYTISQFQSDQSPSLRKPPSTR
ncbi:calumenin-B-like isoform X2 [Momordica charantia]|uniref:Calumenin-B-like isoform X2 n=1 Tax=Momordica charantia TaxID=3673 RepID=A0A6J1CBG1_MOMCH|nr:calumenin-B-like isoform X2 [Momordica charantia]